MVQAKVNQPNWVQYLTLIALVAFVIGSFTWMAPVQPEAPKEVNVQEIVDGVVAGVVIPTASGNLTVENEKIDAIYDELFKEDAKEAKAKELALEELKSKDFREELVDFLMANVGVLEDMDYRDVEDIFVKDVDVELSENVTEVEVEFKVAVSNYGDEDETEKARLSVVFYVEDLDEEEDFEDAEVSGFDSFDLIRFYD